MYFAAKKIFLQCISFGSATSLSECESVCEFMNVELKQTAESTIYSLETLIKMHLLYQGVIFCSCASLVAVPYYPGRLK